MTDGSVESAFDFYLDMLSLQNIVEWSRKENVRAVEKPSMSVSGRERLRTNDKIEIDSVFLNECLRRRATVNLIYFLEQCEGRYFSLRGQKP